MVALYPFRFDPIFKERPWGGESWEISDRDGAISVIVNGSLGGKSLRWLLENHQDDVLGRARPRHGRFPLLVKVIDARQPLSLQVHPPESLAARLRGEAKTEIWYVAQAPRGAQLFAGLRRGTTRAEFEARLRDGTVMECIHRLAAAAGDAMLVPGGRVHALGGEIVVYEIQQNSDTTYRVFDWNRVDSNGRSRELQIESALRCIDFADFEPAAIASRPAAAGRTTLADENAFRIELVTAGAMPEAATDDAFMILGGVTGAFALHWDQSQGRQSELVCGPGTFCLVPACMRAVRLQGNPAARLLLIRPPRS